VGGIGARTARCAPEKDKELGCAVNTMGRRRVVWLALEEKLACGVSYIERMGEAIRRADGGQE